MKILAIDYGTVRVGTALSFGDSLAEPERILANDESLMTKLEKMCEENGVARIVVGVSENQMAKKSEEFAKKLRAKLKLDVEMFDETLSSHEVQTLLKNRSLSMRKKPIDHLAAAVILQNYLDSKKFDN